MDDCEVTAPQLVTLSRAECLELLAAGSFGRVVVTVGADHRPLVRPVNYVFDQTAQAVTFRSSPGTKLHALLRSASACFEIDDVDVEARTGWSVIVYGVTEPVVQPHRDPPPGAIRAGQLRSRPAARLDPHTRHDDHRHAHRAAAGRLAIPGAGVAARTRSVQQAALARVPDQLSAGGEPDLLLDVRAM